MTYEKFLTEILNHVQASLPSGRKARLQKVQKNNGLVLDGLLISTEGECASPTIYLNSYYHDSYKKGDSLDAIVEAILAQYEKSLAPGSMDLSFFSDFSMIKERIIFRVINRDMNAELLKETPHKDYLDLAVTFLVLLSVHETSDATILIRNEHLALWDTDVNELMSLAASNTPRLLAWDFCSMSDVLASTFFEEDEIHPSAEDLAFPIYILTNRIRMHGAGCILYRNLLSSLARKLDDDFYIIPSSVHEVLLIPERVADSRICLDQLIQEVNRTQVPVEEILSDHAYLYRRDKDEVIY